MYFNFAVLWNVAKLQCKKEKVYIYTLFRLTSAPPMLGTLH